MWTREGNEFYHRRDGTKVQEGMRATCENEDVRESSKL